VVAIVELETVPAFGTPDAAAGLRDGTMRL
jgi:hypothetical protein